MAHKIAKLLLEHAGTFLERKEAIRAALKLGMPLAEIEQYLDWLDAVRAEDRRRQSGNAEEAESAGRTLATDQSPAGAAIPPEEDPGEPDSGETESSENDCSNDQRGDEAGVDPTVQRRED
jgi:DNA-binding transcriptional MerR regulator